MIKRLMQRFWLKVLMFVVRRGAVRSSGTRANRTWRTALFGSVEVTITARKLWEPDGYSRDELIRMLQTVREHEARQGWAVPEPKKPVMLRTWPNDSGDVDPARR